MVERQRKYQHFLPLALYFFFKVSANPNHSMILSYHIIFQLLGKYKRRGHPWNGQRQELSTGHLDWCISEPFLQKFQDCFVIAFFQLSLSEKLMCRVRNRWGICTSERFFRDFGQVLTYLLVLPIDKCISPAPGVAIKATVLKFTEIKVNSLSFPDSSPCINLYLLLSSRNGRSCRIILLCSRKSERRCKQPGLFWRVSQSCSFLSLTINVFGHIRGK